MTSFPGPVLVADLSASLYLAVLAGGRVLSSRVREDVRGEAAHGLLEDCFVEAGLGPDSLSAIAVGAGPGSFTGIRVGVAMGQGLAFARRLPLHPFSSLAALLARVPKAAGGPPAVGLIAANAGRFYVGVRDTVGGYSEALLNLDAVEALASGHPTLVTSGPVAPVVREKLRGRFRAVLRMEEGPDFAAIASLALAGPAAPDGVVRPNYLMASAAESAREARQAGAA